MQPVRLLSVAEQTAAHLRQGLLDGRWNERLPGVVRLAAGCDVSTGVMRAALRQLEAEGLISGRGLGRSRSIFATSEAETPRLLRVRVLRHDAELADAPHTSLVLVEIMQTLEAAGHDIQFFKKSQLELKHDLRRMTRQLETAPADAWIIEAGSRELLEWCATRSTPCLALYGRTTNLSLARTGPDALPACRAAVRHLLALGHRRIVTIVREKRRQSAPGSLQLAILEELTAHGVPTSNYNLPDWEESPTGFNRLLENLFHHTPPTALIVDELPFLVATIAFLARHRIAVPEQVSLVGAFFDKSLDWCHPSIAHIRWDNRHIVRSVQRWVEAVHKGNADRKEINCPAEFFPGGSIGRARNA